jgi:hypothetical protein
MFHSQRAAAISVWLTLGTGFFTVLSWLTPEWWGQLTWPQALLAGVAMTLSASLAIALIAAVGGYGFRLIRPMPDSSTLPASERDPDSIPDFGHLAVLEHRIVALEVDIETTKDGEDTLRAAVQGFMKAPMQLAMELNERAAGELGKFKDELQEFQQRQKTIIEDYQTVSAKQIHSEERDTALEVYINKQGEELSSGLEDVRRGCAKLEEQMKKNDECLRESLHAVHAREQLNEMTREIEFDASQLYDRLKAGEHYTPQDWDHWTNIEHHWERTLKRWIDTSRWYSKAVKERILTVDDNEYDDDWSVLDKQFPTADAVRRFKRHRIIQRHWETVRGDVERGVVLVAFCGGTEREQHGGAYHQ